MLQYIIQPCDTIFSIAQKFGLNYKQIVSVNPKIDNNTISIGQIINIPGFLYKVRSKDTLNKISQKFNIPFNLLLSLNPQIIYNGNISVDQMIFITNKNMPNDIPKQALEFESNSISIIDDIDKEDWNEAQNKLTLLIRDFNELKPILNAQSIPKDLINIINNSIITLEAEINSKNVHEAKVQAYIISEYYRDILDILRENSYKK